MFSRGLSCNNPANYFIKNSDYEDLFNLLIKIAADVAKLNLTDEEYGLLSAALLMTGSKCVLLDLRNILFNMIIIQIIKLI